MSRFNKIVEISLVILLTIFVSLSSATTEPSVENTNSNLDILEQRISLESELKTSLKDTISYGSDLPLVKMGSKDVSSVNANSVVNSGIAFLETSQNSGKWDNGGYLHSFESTCVALRALSKAKSMEYSVNSYTINEAIGYIESMQLDDGSWNSDSDENPNAYAIQALIWAQKAGFSVSESRIQKGVDYLSTTVSSQSGGIYLGNSIRTLQLANENGYVVSSSTLSNAISRLESEQESDGSWDQHGYSTTYGALALSETSSSPDAVQKAVDWVVNNQNIYEDGDLNDDGLNDEGSWSDSPHHGTPWMDDTSLGVQTLVLKSVAPSKIDSTVSWLSDTQRTDGSWDFHGNLYGSSNADATAYSIEALLAKSTGLSVSISLDKTEYSPSSYMWVELEVRRDGALIDISSSDLTVYIDGTASSVLDFQKISTGVYKFRIIAPSTVGSHGLRTDVSTSSGSGSWSASFEVGQTSVSIDNIIFDDYYKPGGIDKYGEPVYRRGDDKPKFTVSLSKEKSELPQDLEVWISIYAPNENSPVKNIKLNSWGTYDVTNTNNWDWSGSWEDGDNDGYADEIPDDIPVGIYRTKARVLLDGTELATQEKTFYVIFDFSDNKKGFVTSPYAYYIKQYPEPEPKWIKGYSTHQYSEDIFKEAIEQINGVYTKNEAVDVLNGFSHTIGGQGYNYPSKIVYSGKGQNCYWYDTITFLKQKCGVCLDYSALMIAYSRSVGIPARNLGARGIQLEDTNNERYFGHAYSEIWNGRYWDHYDPTWDKTSPNGEGTDTYALEGVKFRPYINKFKYYVVARNTPEESFKKLSDLVNIHDKYTYCSDAVDISFDKADYDYGEQMQFNVKIKNTGQIDINKPINLRLFDVPSIATIGIPREIENIKIANSLSVGHEITSYFTGLLPSYGWMNSVYETIGEREIKAEVYYNVGTLEVVTSKYSEKVPGLCIDQTPILSIDLQDFVLQVPSSSSANVSENLSWKREEYIINNTKTLEIYSENKKFEDYTKTILTLENNDYNSHIYALTMPLAGKGDAVYIPSIGKITANLSELNESLDCFITYRQSNETDDCISMYKFARNGTVKDIVLFEEYGVPVVQLNVSWDCFLENEEVKDTLIYFQRFDGNNKSFSSIIDEFSSRVAINDTLTDIEIDCPHEMKVNQTMELIISTFNNGISTEVDDFNITVSKVVGFAPYTVETIYVNSTEIHLIPQEMNNLSYSIKIPANTTPGLWEILVSTDKGMVAKTTTLIDDAFEIEFEAPLSANQSSHIMANATICNEWNATIHNVTAYLNHFHNFNTTKPLVKSLGDLAPYENETVSWELNATESGYLTLDLLVSSDDGGSDSDGTFVKTLSQPSLNILYENKQIKQNEDFVLNVTLENAGDLPASSVKLNLSLPEDVAVDSNEKYIGSLAGKSNITIPFNVTSNSTDDFLIIANVSADQVAEEYPLIFDVLVPQIKVDLLTSPEILLGESTEVTAILNNTGELNFSSVPVKFECYNPGIDNNVVEYIDLNISEEKVISWAIKPEKADVYPVGINVTYDGLKTSDTTQLTVTSLLLSVVPEYLVYDAGEQVTFSVTMKNENPKVSYSNLVLNATVLGPVSYEISKEIVVIDANSTAITYFTYTPPVSGSYELSSNLNNSFGKSLAENVSKFTVLAPLTVPPSINNLKSTTGLTWVNFSWLNPSYSSFNYTEVYLNGILQANTSAEYFNATGIEPETRYTIGTHTVDIYGNVNETWVNATAVTKTITEGTGDHRGRKGTGSARIIPAESTPSTTETQEPESVDVKMPKDPVDSKTLTPEKSAETIDNPTVSDITQASEEEDDVEEKESPGFKIAFAISGLLAALYFVKRE